MVQLSGSHVVKLQVHGFPDLLLSAKTSSPRPSTPMGLFRTGAFSGLDEAERAKDQATHVEGQDPEERGLISVHNTEGSVQPSWVSNHKMCSTLCNRKMTVV